MNANFAPAAPSHGPGPWTNPSQRLRLEQATVRLACEKCPLWGPLQLPVFYLQPYPSPKEKSGGTCISMYHSPVSARDERNCGYI